MMVEAQGKVPCTACKMLGYVDEPSKALPELVVSKVCTACNGNGFIDRETPEFAAWHCLEGYSEKGLKQLFKGKWKKHPQRTARFALQFLGCRGLVNEQGQCRKCGKQHSLEMKP